MESPGQHVKVQEPGPHPQRCVSRGWRQPGPRGLRCSEGQEPLTRSIPALGNRKAGGSSTFQAGRGAMQATGLVPRNGKGSDLWGEVANKGSTLVLEMSDDGVLRQTRS